ncbi:MAG: DUF6020 family protein [Lachnospiraceae bacterium]|nr:DUF6020 family protein [Lachnospiraceae bacterium]
MISRSRKIVFAFVTGFIISFCLVAGRQLDTLDYLDLLSPAFYQQLLLAAVFCTVVVYGLWTLMGRGGLRGRDHMDTQPPDRKDKTGAEEIQEPSGNDQGNSGRIPQLPYAANVCIMLLCWLPALLSIFPGAFSYDATNEWRMVAEGAVTSFHPVLHVLLVGYLLEGFYALTGSYNVGIAVYSVLQMVILANLFAYSISLQRQIGIRRGWQIFSLVFFSLSPVIQLFSICTTKDVLFFGAMLIFIEYLILLYRGDADFWRRKSHIVGFSASIFFTMVLRNNGFYIVLAMGLLLLLTARKFELRKRCPGILFAVGGAALIYLLYVGPFYSLMNVGGGSLAEMLSVPMQQMARVYTYERDSVSEEDLELLYEIIPQEYLSVYEATNADNVKWGFEEETFLEKPLVYLKLRIRLGLQHPLTYINSFLIQTVDYWYPFAVVDGYRFDEDWGDWDGYSSYFAYRVDEPGEEIVLWSAAHEYYNRISTDLTVQQHKWTALFLSPGLYFMVFMFIFFYLWCLKRYSLLVPLFVVWLNFFTVLLGPVALVRYVLIVFYGFPLFLGLAGVGGFEFGGVLKGRFTEEDHEQ